MASPVEQTCPFNRHQLLLDVRLDFDDAWQLVQGIRDVLGAAVAGHGHCEERLFQVSSAWFIRLLLVHAKKCKTSTKGV